MNTRKKYSIIIPVLNEEKFLRDNLEGLLWNKDQAEIIVVDGGSEDNSVNICRELGVALVESPKGRGIQLNRGAEVSEGKILIFLHADTKIPPDALQIIDNCFIDESKKIATFILGFDNDYLLLRLYSFFTRINHKFTTFGDQVIVVRRSFFFGIGGFPSIPILEDYEFLRKARAQTRIHKLPAKVITSSRRFKEKGIIKTQLITAYHLFNYSLGKKPEDIYSDYYK